VELTQEPVVLALPAAIGGVMTVFELLTEYPCKLRACGTSSAALAGEQCNTRPINAAIQLSAIGSPVLVACNIGILTCLVQTRT
ncbi:MAG: hypothetical protein ABI476_03855, partial [Oxalobacteraceae bacterium]